MTELLDLATKVTGWANAGEQVEAFAVRSTDGPVPHAVIVCARLHRLCATESDLESLTGADRRRAAGKDATPPDPGAR